MQGLIAPDRVIVGRAAEVAAAAEFVGGARAERGLVLTGEPGIGKTTLWEMCADAARKHGMRVLRTRATRSELGLSFVGLSDLLEGVELSALPEIPAPQRLALEVALVRAPPGPAPPESLGVSAGLTNALRILAGEQPLLVAIDDVPWLDGASAGALAFAARRLQGEPIRFLLARRPGRQSDLERAIAPAGLDQLELEPLSFGATRALLSERLGLVLPRRQLRRLFEAAGGNPLFALELGRMLLAGAAAGMAGELPVPEVVEDVFGERVAALPRPVRRVLLAVTLSPGLGRSEVVALGGLGALQDALARGVLAVDGERVRVSHPLLAAAAKTQASESERRELHLGLADTVPDQQRQARHLAMGTQSADAELAQTVARAAAREIARGATYDAIELAEHALRLTPPAVADQGVRLLELADYLVIAGELRRATELLEPRIDDLPPGRARARAHVLLGECADHPDEQAGHLEEALRHSQDDSEIRAVALAAKATLLALNWIRTLDRAEEVAQEAVSAAESAGAEVRQRALHALAWVRVMRGRPVDDLRKLPEPHGFSLYESATERPAGVRLIFRGQIREARAVFERLRTLAEERGEARSGTVMHLQLCETALRAGDTDDAGSLLSQWDEWAATESVDSHRCRCRALLAALQGRPDEAARWATEALAIGDSIGDEWSRLESLRARGLAALFAGQPKQSVEGLGAVWEHTVREGIDDPGAFPVAPDLVEALVGLGELDQARVVSERLERLSEDQAHPWGLASVKRCRSLLVFARGGDDDQVAQGLADAASAYGALGLQFDEARALLLLGRAQRRSKKWAAARSSLERAAGAFDQAGCTGWAEQAGAELSRLGARRPAPAGTLTESETRVARLAADGLTNKQIAEHLVISVYTVETHLKRAYGKLGVRSRTQLAARLARDREAMTG